MPELRPALPCALGRRNHGSNRSSGAAAVGGAIDVDPVQPAPHRRNADCRRSRSGCNRRCSFSILHEFLAHSPPLIPSTSTSIRPCVLMLCRPFTCRACTYAGASLPDMPLTFADAGISAFVSPLARPAFALLTKMFISLHISKWNVWLAACFQSYRLHKANHFNE